MQEYDTKHSSDTFLGKSSAPHCRYPSWFDAVWQARLQPNAGLSDRKLDSKQQLYFLGKIIHKINPNLKIETGN